MTTMAITFYHDHGHAGFDDNGDAAPADDDDRGDDVVPMMVICDDARAKFGSRLDRSPWVALARIAKFM